MEPPQQQQQTQTPTPPPPSLPTAIQPPQTTTYPDSLDSSPRSRNTDSWDETTAAFHHHPPQQPPPPPPKLRLMCSFGGHIVPRPHDKSLCYIGGDTRIVVVDRHISLVDLTHRLTKTLVKSPSSSSLTSSSPQSSSFTLKYQLPSEDLDSLISVTTDEDLENMIDEYERLNMNVTASSDVSKSSRLRLFLFPNKPESVTSIGSLLENSTKSEDWFLNALNGTTSGFSDTSSVNCLLGLDDDVLPPPDLNNNHNNKKDVLIKGSNVNNNNLKGNNSGQDVHSVPDLERTSSFGSASSSPSLASLPPIRVHVEEGVGVKVVEEQFGQMNVGNVNPVVVTGVPVSANSVANVEYGNRVLSEDERSDQGGYQKVVQVPVPVPVPQQLQYQQKQSMGFDLTSPDSISSDGSRQKPAIIYQDPLVQIQSNNNNNVNRSGDLSNNNGNNMSDQNARIQLQQQQQQQQQQQMADSAYLMSMSNTQVDPQHTQMHHQQPQFIHTAVPQPQYIQHHPSGAVPMASYYQMYPSQNQHHPHHPALDQQNFVYYVPAPAPARQAPHGYNMQMQQQGAGYAEVSSGSATPLAHNQAPPSGYTTARTTQTVPKSELPAGVYGTTNSGGSQFVQVPASQHQVQPQYVGYSQMHHPSQSVASSASSAGANYGYEFADPAQGQHMYYAAQPMPPQSTAQYQTVTGESGSYLPSDSSTKQQQGRTQQS